MEPKPLTSSLTPRKTGSLGALTEPLNWQEALRAFATKPPSLLRVTSLTTPMTVTKPGESDGFKRGLRALQHWQEIKSNPDLLASWEMRQTALWSHEKALSKKELKTYNDSLRLRCQQQGKPFESSPLRIIID